MDVINQISTLQKKLYNQCGELYEAKEVLGDVLYNKMLDDYCKAYSDELEILRKAAEIHYKNEKFVLGVKYDVLTPHRCGFLWLKNNKAKELALRETYAETESKFELRETALEDREENQNKKAPKKGAPGVPQALPNGTAPTAPEAEPAGDGKGQAAAQEPQQKPAKRARKNDGQLKGQITIENLSDSDK